MVQAMYLLINRGPDYNAVHNDWLVRHLILELQPQLPPLNALCLGRRCLCITKFAAADPTLTPQALQDPFLELLLLELATPGICE